MNVLRIMGCAMALFLSYTIVAAEGVNSDISRLYQTLDSLMDCQQDLIARKEAQINIIKEGMHGAGLTTEQELGLNNRLYDEYVAFRFDSAHHYIKKNLEILSQQGNHELTASCLIRMSHILAVSALFDKAEKTLDGIHPELLSTEGRVAYYNQRAELNLYRSEMAQYTPYISEYIDSTQHYRQLILQIAPKESFEYITNLSSYACERGDVARAIHLFEDYLKKLRQGDRRYSIVTSTLAYFYSRANQPDQQERYLLLSAINDLQGAILENNSLRELSAILMERGEYEKAYTYLSQASNDARLYGSRLRSVQVARMAPLITRAYDAERTQAQRRTNILLIVISTIALLLIGTILYTLSLIRKRRLANEKISRMNAELQHHNAEIRTMNEQIQMVNTEMKEANRIKDEYIGRFLELCSALIHRGEERMRALNRLARDRKLEELYAELKNNRPINEGIRMFHQNFDTAFLNIYPDFISEVNRLLQPDKRFEVSEDSTRLTTELRILALIRLGITDNQKIADILRSSINTIYTYRSTLKSRSTVKDTFEDDIKRIATY